MSVARLARPEILGLAPYVSAAQEPGSLRLNANELPYAGTGLNRYPEAQPGTLRHRLASRYGVTARNVLATRGSSEAIDLLIRAFCRAYSDNVVITPPTFGMYRVYAEMQGAGVREVPLAAAQDFAFDVDALLAACDEFSKLVFVCSPNNPTGNAITDTDLERLVAARAGRSIVVVDEAYIEFSARPSAAAAAAASDNLVVLRTLSKARGLAGARCGAVVAAEPLIELLQRLLPPYAFAAPVTDRLLDALSGDADDSTARAVDSIVTQRDELASALAELPVVRKVWPSEANFLLVRFVENEAVTRALARARILLRRFDGDGTLRHCARITVGTADDNARLLAVLRSAGESA